MGVLKLHYKRVMGGSGVHELIFTTKVLEEKETMNGQKQMVRRPEGRKNHG